MTVDAAVTLIQSAWRSWMTIQDPYEGKDLDYNEDAYNEDTYKDYEDAYNEDAYKDYEDAYDYDDEDDDEYPVYDENKNIIDYVSREEMKNLSDPGYAKWVLDEEEGRRDSTRDRLASERLGRKYCKPVPKEPSLLLTPSRYNHPDNKFCSLASPSPTCELCFRYFCSYCKQGVGGMYSSCYATAECRERTNKGTPCVKKGSCKKTITYDWDGCMTTTTLDFPGVDLSYVSPGNSDGIFNEDFSGFDFTGSDLSYSNFTNCDFRKTNMKKVNMENSNFSASDFRGATDLTTEQKNIIKSTGGFLTDRDVTVFKEQQQKLTLLSNEYNKLQNQLKNISDKIFKIKNSNPAHKDMKL
mgnify:CR=1 FL=1